MITENPIQGILLVNKPKGKTSFSLVGALRKRLGVKKIGHSGTLDPFATGVMVMLIGRDYTRQSDQFLGQDKEYLAELFLGSSTDTYDCEGTILSQSEYVPTLNEVQKVIACFQGELEQIPPMYSAKKIGGKKLYELARQGKEVTRATCKIKVKTDLIYYEYPKMVLRVSCSKGTYIRTLAHDIGIQLSCGAHLTNLQRTRSGAFHLKDCIDGVLLQDPNINVAERLIRDKSL